MSLMPSPVFNGNVFIAPSITPAAGYKAKFFAAGTADPKDIFTDEGLTTPYPSPSNVAEMNALGYALIYLGPGAYKLVFTDADDNEIYTQDDIQGDGSFGTGFADKFGASVGDLIGLEDVNPNLNKFTYIAGYYQPGDGGEGMFRNETSDVPSDGGYTLQSAVDDTKVWFRIPDENGDVRAASFGYVPTVETIQTTQLQAADAYAASIDARLTIQAGLGAQVGAITFNAPEVHFNPGTRIDGVLSPPQPALTFNGTVTGPYEQVFTYRSGAISVLPSFSANQVLTQPQWMGADTANGRAANDYAFGAWIASGAGAYVIPFGDWQVSDDPVIDFPWPEGGQPVTVLGLLDGETGAFTGIYFTDAGATIRLNEILFTNGYQISPYSPTVLGTDAGWHAIGNISSEGDVSAGGVLSGASITTLGNITSSAGTIQATTGQVIAGTAVQAGTSVSAGTFVQATAGTQNLKASGRILKTTSAATNLTLLANTLSATGDALRITNQGTCSSATGPTFTISVGSVSLVLGGSSTLAGVTKYRIEVDVFVTAANTILLIGAVYTDAFATAPSIAFGSNSGTPSGNLSSNQTIAVASSATETQALFYVDLYPA